MERQIYFLLALGLCCYTDIGGNILLGNPKDDVAETHSMRHLVNWAQSTGSSYYFYYLAYFP
jgi:hypothetical protein